MINAFPRTSTDWQRIRWCLATAAAPNDKHPRSSSSSVLPPLPSSLSPSLHHMNEYDMFSFCFPPCVVRFGTRKYRVVSQRARFIAVTAWNRISFVCDSVSFASLVTSQFIENYLFGEWRGDGKNHFPIFQMHPSASLSLGTLRLRWTASVRISSLWLVLKTAFAVCAERVADPRITGKYCNSQKKCPMTLLAMSEIEWHGRMVVNCSKWKINIVSLCSSDCKSASRQREINKSRTCWLLAERGDWRETNRYTFRLDVSASVYKWVFFAWNAAKRDYYLEYLDCGQHFTSRHFIQPHKWSSKRPLTILIFFFFSLPFSLSLSSCIYLFNRMQLMAYRKCLNSWKKAYPSQNCN